ncbi:MAG: hypothetical protein LC737_07960 [Chloroflexi bacterium]|nr:hypothetical protein [Chloroflexota bacterium]
MSNTQTLFQTLDWGDAVFAYGHLFAKEAKLLGLDVPLHNLKVNRDQLAQMILVADFVGLQQVGATEMSMSTSKMLFISTETVLVTRLKDVQSGPVSRAILNQITGDAKKDNAKGIVYRLLGRDSMDPYAVVAHWAMQSLLKNGYYHEEERGKVAQLVAGSKQIANPDQLATLEPAARTVESALNEFELKNPAVYKRLKDDVLASLRSRVEQDRNSD